MSIYRLYNDKMKYEEFGSKEHVYKSNLHWGQRKLLISEIEFLTNNVDKYKNNQEKILIYIGSADGYHINYLYRMFPDLTYHLYDKRRHNVERRNNIMIFNEYFSNDIAKKYKNKNVFVISDIRNLEVGKLQNKEEADMPKIDEIIENDLHIQIKWLEIIQPITSFIKFRLPWYTPYTRTVDGDLYFQPWAGNMSTETRMIPKLGTTKKWDNKLYEGILYHHNTVTRTKIYPKDEYSCLGEYYDPKVEAKILSDYIKKFKLPFSVCELSTSITIFLSKSGKSIRVEDDKYLTNVNIIKLLK